MNRQYRRLLGTAAALIVLGVGVSEAMARTNRALLVGVSKYDNLPEADWLTGPANDAELARDYLANNPVSPFAAENITLIASDVPGSDKPTRAAVLKGLSDLAAKSQAGDFVYIQMSGHGTQQPAADPATETDGRDEIFLPADVGKADVNTKAVSNAILDDEIGAALDAIRDKGAFVWLVIDACHSGTATRALGSDPNEKERKISAASLGLTPDMFPKSEATRGGGAEPERQNALGLTGKDGAADGKRGGMVAFFAAQTIETTPEMPLPAGDPEAKTFGLFTYTMMGRLGENPFVTYRQLSQAILQQYSATSRIKPTPMFEGDLDAPVFGMEPGDAVLQWKIGLKNGVVTLPAGRMNQVEPGSKLAILPGPQSTMEDAIGYLDVRSATNFSSQLAPVAYRERAAFAPEAIPDGAFARIAEKAVNFELVVARPPAGGGADKVNAALDAIASDGKTPVKLKLVEAGQPADLRLFVASETAVAQRMSEQGDDSLEPAQRSALTNEPMLWLLPPSSEITLRSGFRSPQIAMTDADRLRDGLADNLVIISKAANLSRLAAVSDKSVRDVRVEFLIQRADAGEDEFEVIEPGKVPILRPDDSVFIRAANKSRGAVDLNVIHIGNDYTISVAQQAIRLQKSDEQPPTGLFTVDGEGTSYGNERMIAIVTEAKSSTTLDLSYLASKGVRQMTRSAAAPDGFAGLLDDIAKAPATRQMKDFEDKRATKGAVLVFPIETKPAD